MKHIRINKITTPELLILLAVGSMIFSLFILQAALIFLLGFYIWDCFKQEKILLFNSPLDKVFIIFVLIRILSIIFSTNIGISAPYFYKEIIFYSFYFIFSYYLNNSEENYYLIIIKILVIAGVLSSLYGATKVLLGIVERAESSTSGYFTLGTFLTAIYALVISTGKNKKIFASRILWILALSIILIGILFTYNRTHWGIVLLITLIIGIVRERILLLFVLITGVTTVLVVPSLTERFTQLLQFNQNLSDRDVIWNGAKILVFQRPFTGFGIGTFRNIFPLLEQLMDKGVGSWHSDYLQMYFESGIFGLGTFLFLMYKIFFVGIRSLKQSIQPALENMIFPILISIATLYLTAFLSGFILSPINSIQFFLLISLLNVYSAKQNNLTGSPDSFKTI